MDEMYVRQICLVYPEGEIDDKELTDAVQDYLKCIQERIRLLKIGDVTSTHWDSFDDNLVHSWKQIYRGRVREMSTHPKPDIGHRIMTDTLQVTEKLSDCDVERYLICGTYHRLANNLTVGWHPDYESELSS